MRTHEHEGAGPIRHAITAMRAGAALTVAAVIVTVLDQRTLTRQLQAAYATAPGKVDMARSSILTYLFALAAIGVVLWLWLARASGRGRPWSRVVATAVFVAGTALSAYNFTQPHPVLVTIAGLVPCAAGLAAVVFLWQRGSSAHFAH
ncbi:hypothetical protein [Amycolatopsis sp. CA-230715]|uniref:hypothetical protein n=1 Tax=Amycolatopsis sp. CA-230715 TaxID=2745196 RepID=UPI001C02772F|nr:hypothetical protein [Amycolatopsis sp. CA-230715]QWF83791.1 hypothetical protein HUW46_07234 [Amycolatopsis sp. CA-230715]